MRLTIIRMTALLLALIAAQSVSADFEAGQRALEAGNVDEAVAQWQEAANEGDGRAMLELGRLYLQGLGVIQDYVEAHKWLNLAASRGEAVALEERDALAAKMTPEQVAGAQERAAAWQPGDDLAQDEESSSVPAADTGQPPPQAIRAAQSLLAALGYPSGPADGIWGQGTRAAYQAFLRDAGLPQAEVLTPQALRTMRAVAEQQAIAQTEDGTTIAGSAQTPASPETSVPAPVSPDALHHAAQTGDIEVLKATLAAGVDVNARDSRGWTALMHATNKGYPLLVPLLLEAQADLDVRAPDGATALFMAAALGHTEIIELLMKAGADISIQGPKGKTPVDVARTRYGEVDVARDNGEPLAVLALLDGMTWEEAEEFAKKVARELAGEMVSIPGGEFRMGRTKDEGYKVGLPVHSVTVPAFRLGKHEVTFDQWDACVADGGCDGYTPHDGGWGRGNRPVFNVSWDDVQSFIDWLNQKTGGNYRLPTEAEWEYAARAGTTTEYSWGNNIGSNQANCNGCGSQWDYDRTAPVGSFPANAWGLHDMHGNVWEWVQDCWNSSYKGAPGDGRAWESGDCSLRVFRGGAWFYGPWSLRSAYRGGGYRAYRGSGGLGFRLAQDQ